MSDTQRFQDTFQYVSDAFKLLREGHGDKARARLNKARETQNTVENVRRKEALADIINGISVLFTVEYMDITDKDSPPWDV